MLKFPTFSAQDTLSKIGIQVTEKDQVQFIIDHLGFMGATHILRVPKERVNKFLKEEDKFTSNVGSYAARGIKQINLCLEGKPANKYVESLFRVKKMKA